jgi:hypothetical protein
MKEKELRLALVCYGGVSLVLISSGPALKPRKVACEAGVGLAGSAEIYRR